MVKDELRERAIKCRYNPTEVGPYVLHIQWSGTHVPGSPFTVNVVDTRSELDLLAANNFAGLGQYSTAPPINDAPLIIGGEERLTSGGGGGPLMLGGGCVPNCSTGCYEGGTINMSTLSGDGLIFNDDA